ncbi:hypothetical protein [Psychrobacter sp. ANT_H59]|uniref:hypothetical protein n=1 Tax=Psychrobacter sp. ANT_H59 TaxID=2597354 RepID=UPI0011EF965F|nr:hypothetical protein [Psychrobacter sp. ANT_H59]KAA0938631.1 hypothetical protein FQ083_07360 [Psychrobacter sp. ANT_H59]
MEQTDIANEVAQKTELAEGSTGKVEAVTNFLSNLLETVGPEYFVAIVFFFGAHWYLHKLYKSNLDNRQLQIDRLAADNSEYRDRFLAILDEKFSYDSTTKKSNRKKAK